MDAKNLYGYAISNFFPTGGFKWIDRKEFDLNKYTSNSYVLEVDIVSPKELRKIQNDYSLVPDKIKIQEKMVSSYQLKIADLCNIPICNVKITFLIKKSICISLL